MCQFGEYLVWRRGVGGRSAVPLHVRNLRYVDRELWRIGVDVGRDLFAFYSSVGGEGRAKGHIELEIRIRVGGAVMKRSESGLCTDTGR